MKLTIDACFSDVSAGRYQYDNMNRLTKLTNFRDDNNNGVMDFNEGISQFDYTLDQQGRKIQADERFWVDGHAKTNHIDWMYDNAGRLVWEVYNHYDDEFDQTLQWQYDLVGNRLLQKLDKGNDGIWDAVTTGSSGLVLCYRIYTFVIHDMIRQYLPDESTFHQSIWFCNSLKAFIQFVW